ncbi:MAG: TonB-dependent receptor [Muribaculaceae bacterium]|nr:TonB-dependent receptor [Muribaculaceae bacterium]
MMKFFLVYLLLIFCSLIAVAQIDVKGRVIDAETKEVLVGASVIIKGADGKIKKYSSSKANGDFTMTVPSIDDCRLDVTMMGFEKLSIPLDSVTFPLEVMLFPGSTLLKEVTVKADRIREQGDTITYNVGSFAQAQDRSIGDVLKRMPGITVENTGKIQYQGEDINKFYIEGSDLLGGKYGIATNGINHDDVGAVEVMENHQPMQVLSGISFSDRAAINLKLKNKAKATWTVHGDAGGGYSRQPEGAVWDGEIFAMAVMPGFQNITTVKTNNIGEDLSSQKTDFFSSSRGTALNDYVNISLPGVPNLSRKRTLFNRSVLASLNSLWKLKNGEFKSQIDYSFNRITADAINITTYFLDEANRIIAEDRNGKDKTHSLSAKFIYELNQKTAFINNTLKTNLDWDNLSLGMTGTLPNDQSAYLPDYYVANDFKLIKRFKGKHLVTFKSMIEWESLPQNLSVNMFDFMARQKIRDHSFFTDESAAYTFSLKGVTLSLEGGVKGYVRSMNSEITGILEEIPGDFINTVSTNYFTVYAVPKFEYWVNRFNFTFNVPLSYSYYRFDKAIADRNEFYFSPSLSVNWKPNNKLSLTLRGGTGRSPMSLNLIQPGLIMTDYRSFRIGTDNFYNSSSQNISASVTYRHTRHGLFANAYVMQSWSHLPYALSQQLLGDYILYSYADAKSSGKIFMGMGSVGKTLDFIRGSLNLNGSYSRNESHLLSQNEEINSIGTSWSAGLKINGTPVKWFGIDYKFNYTSSRLEMNSIKEDWLGSMENELLFNIMPHKKWEWHISGEYYRNELTTDFFKNVFLLDTKVIFKLNKKIEFSGSLTNILNQKTYNYITYNQLNSFESQRWLRGRELLFTITLRK